MWMRNLSLLMQGTWKIRVFYGVTSSVPKLKPHQEEWLIILKFQIHTVFKVQSVLVFLCIQYNFRPCSQPSNRRQSQSPWMDDHFLSVLCSFLLPDAESGSSPRLEFSFQLWNSYFASIAQPDPTFSTKAFEKKSPPPKVHLFLLPQPQFQLDHSMAFSTECLHTSPSSLNGLQLPLIHFCLPRNDTVHHPHFADKGRKTRRCQVLCARSHR